VTKAIGDYKRSKILAEALVTDMVERLRLPVVIVNPSTPIGPRDVRPTPTGQIIVRAASGRLPAFVDTGLNFVHVDDVAAGHVAALQRGRIGERYILGGENVALSALLADIAKIVGRRPPRVRLPHASIYPVAVAAELLARFTGRVPFVTRNGLRMSRQHMYFVDTKARRELGYVSRPYREGIVDAIAWFERAGYLGPLPSRNRPLA
jgi:dihydroflavonol-4-reductase